MSSIQLYMAPGTCARVTCIALEEVGEPFETILIRFMKGEHKSPEFKQLNPKGKVPTLVVDGKPLTENVAILSYLHEEYPDARLLPHVESDFERLQQLADLCFCASTLHPIVTRIRMPQFFAEGNAARSVWEKGCAAMNEYFGLVEKRLEASEWWYDDQWSIVDAYLYWIFWRCEGANYNVNAFPGFKAHATRMEARPATRRALEREAALQAQLDSEGLAFTPPSFS